MIVVLKSNRNTHFATGEYDGHKIVVLPGSKINLLTSYSGMSKLVKAYREDPEIVSPKGEVLRAVSFESPSAAAQFVTGRSVNGYVSWRIDDKLSLKEHKNQNR